jgi:hypothetical protein
MPAALISALGRLNHPAAWQRKRTSHLNFVLLHGSKRLICRLGVCVIRPYRLLVFNSIGAVSVLQWASTATNSLFPLDRRGGMAIFSSVWGRFGTRRDESAAEYALLSSSPSSAVLEDDLPEFRSTQSPPLISWSTNPTFEIQLNLEKVQHFAVPCFLALLPSFIRPSVRRAPRKLFATSYLDGLRGVAALFVVIHHYSLT